MHGYLVATLQYGISGNKFIWCVGLGVRGRSKWIKSGLYGSIVLVRRGKQHGVTLLWWYLLLIYRFRKEISRSDLNWLNLAMTLLKALFELRWITPSGKNLWSDLNWLGHCNVGTCACRFLVGGVVSGAYFIVQELLWFAKRMKVKSLVVVCCGMIFRSWCSFFLFFFHRLCAS